MSMLSFDFVLAVLKFAFSAFTAGCMIVLIYGRIEQLLPNILLKRASVTYQGPSKSLGLLLILIGAVGLAAFVTLYSMGSSRSVLEIVLIGSALIFDAGTVLFIWSEKRTPRGSEALIG
jgi:hypothetical protein